MANIILVADRMEKLPFTLKRIRTIVTNMKENMFFAITMVALLLIGVFSKSVFLAYGMMFHELSVLVVILNAIRLLTYKGK